MSDTHRVYLRWPPQRTSDKTSTDSADVARFAFDQLKARKDLEGQDVAIAWTCNGEQLAYHDFSSALKSIAKARQQLRSE